MFVSIVLFAFFIPSIQIGQVLIYFDIFFFIILDIFETFADIAPDQVCIRVVSYLFDDYRLLRRFLYIYAEI